MSSSKFSIVTEIKTVDNLIKRNNKREELEKQEKEDSKKSKNEYFSSSDDETEILLDIEQIYPKEKRERNKQAILKEEKAIRDMKRVFDNWEKNTKNKINKSKQFESDSTDREDKENLKKKREIQKEKKKRQKVYKRTAKSIRDFSTARIPLPIYARPAFVPSGNHGKHIETKYEQKEVQKRVHYHIKKTKKTTKETNASEATELEINNISSDSKAQRGNLIPQVNSPKHLSIANMIRVESSDSDEEFIKLQREKINKYTKGLKKSSIYFNNSDSSDSDSKSSDSFRLWKSRDKSSESDEIELLKPRKHNKLEDEELKMVLDGISDTTSDSDDNDYEFFNLEKEESKSSVKKEATRSYSYDDSDKEEKSYDFSSSKYSSPIKKVKTNNKATKENQNESTELNSTDPFKLTTPKHLTSQSASSKKKTVSYEEEEENSEFNYAEEVKRNLDNSQKERLSDSEEEDSFGMEIDSVKDSTRQSTFISSTTSKMQNPIYSEPYSNFDDEIPSPRTVSNDNSQRKSSITKDRKKQRENAVSLISPEKEEVSNSRKVLSKPVSRRVYSSSSYAKRKDKVPMKYSLTEEEEEDNFSSSFKTPKSSKEALNIRNSSQKESYLSAREFSSSVRTPTNSQRSSQMKSNITEDDDLIKTPSEMSSKRFKSSSQKGSLFNEEEELGRSSKRFKSSSQKGSLFNEEEELGRSSKRFKSSSQKGSLFNEEEELGRPSNKFRSSSLYENQSSKELSKESSLKYQKFIENNFEEEDASLKISINGNFLDNDNIDDYSDDSTSIPHPHTPEWDAWIKKQVEAIEYSEESANEEVSPQNCEDREYGAPIIKPSTSSQPSALSISESEDSPQVIPRIDVFAYSYEEDEDI